MTPTVLEGAIRATAEALAVQVGGRTVAGILKRLGADLCRTHPHPRKTCKACWKQLARKTRGDYCRAHVGRGLDPLALRLRGAKAGATLRRRHATDPEFHQLQAARTGAGTRASVEKRLGWVPEDLRDERRTLVRSLGALEADRLIRERMAAR
jgi:hypothetical protein